MDCPICFNAITPATGQMTTSCGHTYHFSCIASWYSKQETGTCPCCRSEATETEAMPAFSDDESEAMPDVSDDESEGSYEEDEVEFTREQLQAFLKSRGGSGLTETMLNRVCGIVGGFTFAEIHMLCVGNDARPLSCEEWANDWSLWRSVIDVPNPEELV